MAKEKQEKKIENKYHILQDKSKADFEGMLEDFELSGYKPLWETYKHTVCYDDGGFVQDSVFSIVLVKEPEKEKEK